jgi:hypothetical protein
VSDSYTLWCLGALGRRLFAVCTETEQGDCRQYAYCAVLCMQVCWNYQLCRVGGLGLAWLLLLSVRETGHVMTKCYDIRAYAAHPCVQPNACTARSSFLCSCCRICWSTAASAVVLLFVIMLCAVCALLCCVFHTARYTVTLPLRNMPSTCLGK